MTEKELAYTILNSFGGSHSDDNDLRSLRQIRSWIHTERANILLNFTDTGRSLPEELFQELGDITFARDSSNLFFAELPKIIYFNKKTGIKIRVNGEMISLCTRYKDEAYKKNLHLEKTSRAYAVGTKLYIRYFSDLTTASIDANIDAVLFEPVKAPNYNWQTDTYPINAEILKAIKQQAKESEQIILNPQLEDKVQDTVTDGPEKTEVQYK